MFFDYTVEIPYNKGRKILIQRPKGKEYKYVLIVAERAERDKRHFTTPMHVSIGRVCADNPKLMHPNQSYIEYFGEVEAAKADAKNAAAEVAQEAQVEAAKADAAKVAQNTKAGVAKAAQVAAGGKNSSKASVGKASSSKTGASKASADKASADKASADKANSGKADLVGKHSTTADPMARVPFSDHVDDAAFRNLRMLCEGINVQDYLNEHFGQEVAACILDLAAFVVTAEAENNTKQYFNEYGPKHPSFSQEAGAMSDAYIANFLSQDHGAAIDNFFKAWVERNKLHSGSDYVYIYFNAFNRKLADGNLSILPAGTTQLSNGSKGSEGSEDSLNLAIVYDAANRMPLFYVPNQAAVNGAVQCQNLLAAAKYYGFDSAKFILENAAFSRDNIAFMEQQDLNYFLVDNGANAFFDKVFDKYRESPECNSSKIIKHAVGGNPEIHAFTVKHELWQGAGRKCYFHFFSDLVNAAVDLANILRPMMLFGITEGQDISRKRIRAKDIPYSEFLKLDVSSDGYLRKVNLDHAAFQHALESKGKFVIVSREKLQAQEAYDIYFSRDKNEHLFGADKPFLDQKKWPLPADKVRENVLFVEFIALIIRCCLYTIERNQNMQ